MLVLSRKEGERLHIGDDVTLVVTRCGRGRVTVGIEAPEEIRILRGEVLESHDNDLAEALCAIAGNA